MEPTAATMEANPPVIEVCPVLPRSRREWSSGAQTAYHEVLTELDLWCRTHDSPRILNSWIAEEAVRSSW